ncbi:MAG: hypothetical protein GVY19_01005 [Bacteroidetes bacterium]|jgi:hypothetical protein|nr:hypothetical protein [Bacteroidota bacterium]
MRAFPTKIRERKLSITPRRYFNDYQSLMRLSLQQCPESPEREGLRADPFREEKGVRGQILLTKRH